MSMLRSCLLICLLILGLPVTSSAQEKDSKADILSLEEAIKISLENNYDIQIATRDVQTAEINASVLNSGYLLPRLTANGVYNFSEQEVTVDPSNGFVFQGGSTNQFQGSVSLNYTLFDIFSIYNYGVLKGSFALSKLQARQTIETTLSALYNAYYQVSFLYERKNTLANALEISNFRVKRAGYGYELGGSLEIDYLNAQVDRNTDSVNLLNATLDYRNAKRNFNLLLGRDISTPFEIDTAVRYVAGLTLESLLKSAEEDNVSLLLNQQTLKINEDALSGAKWAWLPSLAARGTYSYTKNVFQDNPNRLNSQTIIGIPTAGVTLTWNLFDGGRTIAQYQTAKVALERTRIEGERASRQIELNIKNAWATYINSLFVFENQNKNLEVAQANFTRSQQRYTLGQITSIDFRQAQLNLLNAELSFDQAKYDAKNAEVTLLQLSGMLTE